MSQSYKILFFVIFAGIASVLTLGETETASLAAAAALASATSLSSGTGTPTGTGTTSGSSATSQASSLAWTYSSQYPLCYTCIDNCEPVCAKSLQSNEICYQTFCSECEMNAENDKRGCKAYEIVEYCSCEDKSCYTPLCKNKCRVDC